MYDFFTDLSTVRSGHKCGHISSQLLGCSNGVVGDGDHRVSIMLRYHQSAGMPVGPGCLWAGPGRGPGRGKGAVG